MAKSTSRQRAAKKMRRLAGINLLVGKGSQLEDLNSDELYDDKHYDDRYYESEPKIKSNTKPRSPSKVSSHLTFIIFKGEELDHQAINKLFFEGKYPCGYLRSLHLYKENDKENYTGRCALRDMGECSFPHVSYKSCENKCPVYVSETNEMIEQEQRRLSQLSWKRG